MNRSFRTAAVALGAAVALAAGVAAWGQVERPAADADKDKSARRIEVSGSAHDNSIYHSYLGTNFDGTASLGNTLGGIFLGSGTSGTTIGGTSASYQNRILYSVGDGVTIQSSRRNRLSGNEISGGQAYGLLADGICTGTVVRDNTITSNAAGNVNLTKSRGVTYIP